MPTYTDLLNEAINLPPDVSDEVLDAKVRAIVMARIELESPSIRDTPSRRAELFVQERRALVKERAAAPSPAPSPAPAPAPVPEPKAK